MFCEFYFVFLFKILVHPGTSNRHLFNADIYAEQRTIKRNFIELPT